MILRLLKAGAILWPILASGESTQRRNTLVPISQDVPSTHFMQQPILPETALSDAIKWELSQRSITDHLQLTKVIEVLLKEGENDILQGAIAGKSNVVRRLLQARNASSLLNHALFNLFFLYQAPAVHIKALELLLNVTKDMNLSEELILASSIRGMPLLSFAILFDATLEEVNFMLAHGADQYAAGINVHPLEAALMKALLTQNIEIIVALCRNTYIIDLPKLAKNGILKKLADDLANNGKGALLYQLQHHAMPNVKSLHRLIAQEIKRYQRYDYVNFFLAGAFYAALVTAARKIYRTCIRPRMRRNHQVELPEPALEFHPLACRYVNVEPIKRSPQQRRLQQHHVLARVQGESSNKTDVPPVNHSKPGPTEAKSTIAKRTKEPRPPREGCQQVRRRR